MTLPNVHRLRHRQDFNTVYQLGMKRTTPHLILRALPPIIQNPDAASDLSQSDEFEPPTRIGISVSQKVSKRAVVRNRIKRQLRAALRRLLPGLIPGWQLVIIAKPNASECDYEEFLRELEELLINTEVFNGHSGRSLL
ncbi:ribonuclease P protein component [Thermocoleostomius sinensis]|uniref:Ribonuclease P protein component n=1 Tax=Thermocoleostomius sinensis A174 TaxID=2016057 RepID=A0A9E8ZPI7_9CYAN|nr:ribonuclease P protein component [Thermocoleostomius sinensis]WAL62531.1 ribonuclease P protein component [Thermocoleostomius sinensis A174]